MLRKLFAAMFAATLLAGTAWGGQVDMGTITPGTTKEASAEGGIGTGFDINVLDVPTGNIKGATATTGGLAADEAIYVVDGEYNLKVSTNPLLIIGGTGGTGAAGDIGGLSSLLVGVDDAGAAKAGASLEIGSAGMTLTKGAAGSAGPGGAAYVGIMSGAELANSGTINVGADTTIGFAAGSTYSGDTGTINLSGTMLIGAAAKIDGGAVTGVVEAANITTAAGVTGLGKIFAATDLKAGGEITATLAAGANLGTEALALKAGAAAGTVTIDAKGASTIANVIDLKGSDLVVDANSANAVTITGAITAAKVTTQSTATGGSVVLKSAVNADVVANTATSFIGPDASLTGGLDVATATTVAIGGTTADEAANITLGAGKILNLNGSGTSVIDVKANSSLTIANGALTNNLAGTNNKITVQDTGKLYIDANVNDKTSTTTNKFTDVLALVTLNDTAELTISNAANVASVGAVTVATAGANAGVVNVGFAGKTMASLDVNNALLNVTDDIIVTGAVLAADGATTADVVGLKVANGVTATFGSVDIDDNASVAGVEFGQNSDITVTTTLASGGNVASLTGAWVSANNSSLASSRIIISRNTSQSRVKKITGFAILSIRTFVIVTLKAFNINDD